MLRSPWMGAPAARPGRAVRARWDSTLAAVRDSVRAERAAGPPAAQHLRRPRPEEESRGAPRPRACSGSAAKYADVAMDGQVRLEIRTDRVAQRALQPRAAAGSQFRLHRRVPGAPPGQPGQPAVDRHPRPAGPPQHRLRLRAGLRRQQRRPGVLRGAGGRDHPPGRGRHRHSFSLRPPASSPPPFRPTTSASMRSFEVGRVQLQALAATQKGSQVAERVLHRGPDHQPAAGQAGPRPRLRDRPLLLGDRSRPACPAIRTSTSSISTRPWCSRASVPTRSGSTATAPR